ncbi:MAG: sugar transferase [Clostridia bacterium]|nr:sugar transferase [Clostridia bacterium]
MNQKRRVGWLKHYDFMLLDLLCMEFSLLLASFIRHGNLKVFTFWGPYRELNIFIIGASLCYVLLLHGYKDVLKRGPLTELKDVVIQNFVSWGIAMGLLYMGKDIEIFSRTVFSYGVIFSTLSIFAARLIWKNHILKKAREGRKHHLPRAIIITSPEKAETVINRINKHGNLDFDIEGIVLSEGSEADTVCDIPVVSSLAGFFEYMKTAVVDDVFIFLPQEEKRTKEIIQTLLDMGVVVHIGLDMWGYDLPNNYCEHFGGYNFLTTSISTAGVLHLLIKRIIDICAGLAGCFITGIAFLFVAPAIYKASPGPIFYSQIRVGKNGRRFKIYKFRSMYMDADARKAELMAQNEMQGNMFKMENDPRIIGSEKGPGKGIGNLIRRLSIDELPQFYNILKGDMSLVGTRPPTVDEVEQYDLHHMIRLSMKPGLTGMWQVSGRNKITDFEEVVKLDAAYIKNWSLKLDMKIILKTFVTVLKSDGAV